MQLQGHKCSLVTGAGGLVESRTGEEDQEQEQELESEQDQEQDQK